MLTTCPATFLNSFIQVLAMGGGESLENSTYKIISYIYDIMYIYIFLEMTKNFKYNINFSFFLNNL